MKSITACVEFDDYLALTLPRNARHFEEVLVITAPQDQKTPAIVKSVPGARLLVTDAFYRPPPAFNRGQSLKEDLKQPLFNRGLAIEEGLDLLGRQGWLIFWDADIVMPEELNLAEIKIGNFYSAHRRQCPNPENWSGQMNNWSSYPLIADTELAGYFQLFHSADPVLKRRPWYPTNWRSCAGSDSEFQDKWPAERKKWLPFEVLHLGDPQGLTNAWGRETRRLDGTIPANAEACKQRTQKMHAERPRYGFRKEKWEPTGLKGIIYAARKKMASFNRRIQNLRQGKD